MGVGKAIPCLAALAVLPVPRQIVKHYFAWIFMEAGRDKMLNGKKCFYMILTLMFTQHFNQLSKHNLKYSIVLDLLLSATTIRAFEVTSTQNHQSIHFI